MIEEMSKHIDPKYIPAEYGGQAKYSNIPDSCRWQSPEEREYCAIVRKLGGLPPKN
jgi:hypothetical protein